MSPEGTRQLFQSARGLVVMVTKHILFMHIFSCDSCRCSREQWARKCYVTFYK